jgi:PIN domain nuclease of toxin-antitoxin system
VNVLVDTKALIWWLLEPRHLSIIGRSAIQQADEVFVSAVSIYEVDYKREKLRSSGHLANSILARMPRNMPGSLPQLGLTVLDVTADVAWRAARLPLIHKDPWDRLLIAQAMSLDAPLVSVDAALSAYDVEILW